jgi:hypothetical protein
MGSGEPTSNLVEVERRFRRRRALITDYFGARSDLSPHRPQSLIPARATWGLQFPLSGSYAFLIHTRSES